MAAVLQKRGPRQGLKPKSQRMESISSFQAMVHMFFSASLRQPCRPQQVWGRLSFNVWDNCNIYTAPTQNLCEAREQDCLSCPLPNSNVIGKYSTSLHCSPHSSGILSDNGL